MIENSASDYQVGPSGFYEATPRDGFIKAIAVRIGWNTDAAGRVTEVLVTADAEEWTRKNRRYAMTGGACFSDWCLPVAERRVGAYAPDQLFDPAGAFGSFMAVGFANKVTLRDTLIQFAKIEEAVWARRMLFAVEGEWNDSDVR